MAKKKQSNQGDPNSRTIVHNRRASFDYHLLDRFEAGLVLTGTEIKSVRNNQVSLQQSYVRPQNGELWLIDADIAPYEHGSRENHDSKRPRKLLLHGREIGKIIQRLTERGLTIVPTKLYLKKGRAKLEIALAKGKQRHDKRQSIAQRDSERQVERALRQKYQY